MDSIVLKQNVMRWNKTLGYLVAHRADLTDLELSAIDTLAQCWQKNDYSTAMVRMCNEAIDVLKSQHKYHSNNKEVITNVKDFCAVAVAMYTRDEATFNQFRGELRKTVTSQPAQSSRPAPVLQPRVQVAEPQRRYTTITPQASAARQGVQSPQSGVMDVLIKQDVAKWRDGMQFLNDNSLQLTQDELQALSILKTIFNQGWSQGSVAQARNAVNVLTANEKFHSNNRRIIEANKNIKLIVKRYVIDGDAVTCGKFAAVLKDYLKSHPIAASRPAPSHTAPQQVPNYTPYSRTRYQGLTLWQRFDNFILRIGNWFARNVDVIPDNVSLICIALGVIGLVLLTIGTWVSEGFITALIVAVVGGILGLIALSVFTWIVEKMLTFIMVALRFIFYAGWTFLLFVAIVIAIVL